MSYILTVVSKFYLKNQTKKNKKWEKKFSCIECACSPDTGVPGVYPLPLYTGYYKHINQRNRNILYYMNNIYMPIYQQYTCKLLIL